MSSTLVLPVSSMISSLYGIISAPFSRVFGRMLPTMAPLWRSSSEFATDKYNKINTQVLSLWITGVDLIHSSVCFCARSKLALASSLCATSTCWLMTPPSCLMRALIPWNVFMKFKKRWRTRSTGSSYPGSVFLFSFKKKYTCSGSDETHHKSAHEKEKISK